MRIVHVITRLIVGGAQENTVLSCEALRERGHLVHLFAGPTTGPEGSLVGRAASGGYDYEEFDDLVRAVNPCRDVRALVALRRRFEQLRPDVVHTHSSKAGVLGRIAADLAGVPNIVHTIHGMSFNRTQPSPIRVAYRLVEQFCAGRSHALVSVADAMTHQALAAGIGTPAQHVTIRSGMEVSTFDPRSVDAGAARSGWGIDEDDIVVGTVARLFLNKGYEQLIEIMDMALRREPRLRFLWVGDGADRQRYEAELTSRGLRDRTIITGLLPPAEMPRALAAMDLLAHTSQWEGLPRAVVQALLMERPAVSFDIDGAPEVVRPNETGELVRLNDLRAFASAVVRLAQDPERRIAYGRRGRANCARAFDHGLMADQLERLYRRLASR